MRARVVTVRFEAAPAWRSRPSRLRTTKLNAPASSTPPPRPGRHPHRPPIGRPRPDRHPRRHHQEGGTLPPARPHRRHRHGEPAPAGCLPGRPQRPALPPRRRRLGRHRRTGRQSGCSARGAGPPRGLSPTRRRDSETVGPGDPALVRAGDTQVGIGLGMVEEQTRRQWAMDRWRKSPQPRTRHSARPALLTRKCSRTRRPPSVHR